MTRIETEKADTHDAFDTAGPGGPGGSASAALDAPGSTKVSSILMQDAVPAGAVSLAHGAQAGKLDGKAALFANPFLDGKEEAVAVSEKGELTYLQRDSTDTGWLQTKIKAADGKTTITAREVVVVVHPQDAAIYAIYTPDAAGAPQALRLVSTRVAGRPATCRWEPRAGVVAPAAGQPAPTGLSRLHVYYQNRTPIITAMNTDSHVVSIAAVFDNLTVNRFLATTLPVSFAKSGAVDEVVGGRVTVPAGGVETPGTTVIAYLRFGSKVIRYSTGNAKGPEQIADDAVRLAGVFQATGPADVGLVFLDTGERLRTYNQTMPYGSAMQTATPNLGFTTATVWNDVNQLMHVYGLDSAGTLQVVHEEWADGTGAPFWSSAKAVPPPPEPPVETSVVMCVGLVPKVASFALDPFPDYQPSELVVHEGAKAPHDQVGIYTQDITSTRWSRDKVRLPSTGDPHVVTHYVSSVTVLDKRGKPMPGLPVKVSADTLAEIQIDGASYLVGPGHSVAVATTAFGKVTIASPADGLLPATLHVDAVGLASGAVVQPAAAIHDYLAGTGTLSSQKGLFGKDALTNAKADGTWVVDPDRRKDIPSAVSGTRQVFEVAAGKKPTSRLYTGPGAAPEIHGFSVGSGPTAHLDGAEGAVYQEFETPEQLDAYVESIRALPQYAGIWDSFTSWAGDIWQGIKNGIVKVYDVVVGTAAKVFVWMKGKIAELTEFVIDTVQDAVQTVEAVLAKVVDTVHKVVDWLKALFSFKDAWQTKTALEGTVATLCSFGKAQIKEYKRIEHGWFVKQEGNAHDAFKKLKERYGDRALGDVANQMPALKDPSGHTLTTEDVASNGQASWLLDQTLSRPVMAVQVDLDFALDADSPVLKRFTEFEESFALSGLVKTVRTEIKTPADAAGKVMDSTVPDPGSRASVAGLLELLESLVVKVLEGMDKVTSSVLDLGLAVIDAFQGLLDTPLPIPGLSDVYRWVQKQAGVAEGEIEELTLGGLLFLIAGFWVTAVYKLLHGVDAPPLFPGGKSPVIPPPPSHPDYRGPQRMDAEQMHGFLIACGALALIGAAFDAANDLAPLAPEGTLPGWAQYFMTTGSIVFTAIFMGCWASCPSVLGVDWESPAGIAFSVAFGVQNLYLLACAGALLWSAWDKFTFWPQLKNIGGVLAGPVVATLFAGASLVPTIIGCYLADSSGLDYAQAAVGAVPGLVQFVRMQVAPLGEDPTFPFRLGGVAIIDEFATLAAGAMLIALGAKQAGAPTLA